MLARLPDGVAVLCTTATANDRVVADVAEQLGVGRAASAADLPRRRSGARACASRSSSCPAQADRLAWLAERLPAAAGLGDRLHAHQARRRARRRVADRPRHRRPRPTAARSTTERRIEVEERLLRNELKAVVATSALGHGLRQARPRVRRALPGAGLGHRLLPAGRPRRPRRSSAPRSCCCAAPRTAGSRTSSSSRRSRARERRRRACSSTWTRRRRRRRDAAS